MDIDDTAKGWGTQWEAFKLQHLERQTVADDY